jgi:two-component system, OmpR family, response regulator
MTGWHCNELPRNSELDCMAQRILVIEHDPGLRALLARHLPGPDLEVQMEHCGASGLRRAATAQWDLFLVERSLPDSDGLQICKQIRAASPHPSAIFLAGDGSEQERIDGFDAGADDYISKPFCFGELKARIRARLRRPDANQGSPRLPTSRQELTPLRIGNLYANPQTREVECAGLRVQLTAREFQLLFFLARHSDRAWTREQLLARIWGDGFEGYAHTVSSHVNRLRSKLQRDPTHSVTIVTVWGAGYRFSAATQATPAIA